MKKILVFLAALFFVPTLALASDQCNTITDAQYEAQIAGQSYSEQYEEDGVSLNASLFFNPNHILIMELAVDTEMG